MKVLGYSERGIMNALFYDLARAADPRAILYAFFAEAAYPFTRSRPVCGDADVLLEQSFSDFGDADAVVLIRGDDGQTCSVFIEAKVKTFQVWDWRIVDEFAIFRRGLESQLKSSNLFTQLFHKQWLVNGLRSGLSQLENGLRFPSWSSKEVRRIGSNGVVLEAVRRVQAHLGQVFYLAIVPDTPANAAAFFPTLQFAPHPSLMKVWDVAGYGYLTWSQVQAFCTRVGLVDALKVFEYNKGQIYREQGLESVS